MKTFIFLLFCLFFTGLSFSQDGTLDHSFGNGGKVVTKLSSLNDVVTAIKLFDNGKVLAAGYSTVNGKYGFSLVKYNSDGSFDNSFNDSGKVFTSLTANPDYAGPMVIQPDGKIVVGGFSQTASFNADLAVVRYNSNGTLDNSFGTGGIVVKDLGEFNDVIHDITLQQDGKIVAVGYSIVPSEGARAMVIRFKSNGDLDSTFGTNGVVFSHISNLVGSFSGVSVSYGVRVQQDGKIVVGGNYNEPGNQARAFIARYNSDGTFDTSFDGDGIKPLDFNIFSIVDKIDIQPDGKIVSIGHNGTGLTQTLALVRLNTNGSFDNNFGVNGKVTTSFDNVGAFGKSIVILENRVLVIGHTSDASGNSKFISVRYNYNGTLDTGFGTAGKIVFDFGQDKNIATSVSVNSSGSFVLGGYTSILSVVDEDYALAKFNSSIGLPGITPPSSEGALDLNFGDSGKVITDLSNLNDVVSAVHILDNGKIYAIGYGGVDNSATKLDFALVRYNADGSLDNTFGDSGKVFTSIGTVNDYATCMLMQPDGKIVLAGYTVIAGNNTAIAIVRYNSNGSLDQSFGNNGIISYDIDSQNDVITDISLQNDGKIVVTGSSQTASLRSRALTLRYNSNGSLDNSFGNAGLVITDLSNLIASYEGVNVSRSVKIQEDGKIVVGASYHIPGNSFRSCVFRLNPNGSLDTSFDGDGIATTDFNDVSLIFSIDIQPNGKIVTFGQAVSSGSQQFALTRHNSDGSLDQSFGSNGKVLTLFENETAFGRGLVVLADKLLVSGYINNINTGFSKFAAARYNYDGTLDNNFGVGGKTTTSFPSANINVANALSVQSNGSFVLGGYVNIPDGIAFALAKFNGTALIPVELASFSASVENNSVTLSWKTITELNNAGFEIERKYGDFNQEGDFSTIAFVKGNGTTQNINTYLYTDSPTERGTYTYRLKQVDLNGEFSYSAPLTVLFDSNLLNSYSLSQNYPNPFNPTTVINFTIPVKTYTNLSVYDITGALVESLVNSELEKGVYNINFSAKNLSSGVYFYSLKAGDFHESKKMIITK